MYLDLRIYPHRLIRFMSYILKESKLLAAQHRLRFSGRAERFRQFFQTWRDPRHVSCWRDGAHNLYEVNGSEEPIETVWAQQNGHQTDLPGTHNEWLLTDTYAHGEQREQKLFLYPIPTGKTDVIARLHSPTEYQGEWRCDAHPRFSRSGRKVVIDSAHGGNGRQMYLMDLSEIHAN